MWIIFLIFVLSAESFQRGGSLKPVSTTSKGLTDLDNNNNATAQSQAPPSSATIVHASSVSNLPTASFETHLKKPLVKEKSRLDDEESHKANEISENRENENNHNNRFYVCSGILNRITIDNLVTCLNK